MRSSESAPTKGEPAFVRRSPLQPTRSAASAAAGSVTAAEEEKAGAPSRKPESGDAAEGV